MLRWHARCWGSADGIRSPAPGNCALFLTFIRLAEIHVMRPIDYNKTLPLPRRFTPHWTCRGSHERTPFWSCQYSAMTSAPIDFTSLHKALSQLTEAIVFWQARADSDPLKPHLRSAVIQSFEFTYELAVRTLRRVPIERSESADLVRDLSFGDLIRRALDAGLPTDLTRNVHRRW